MMHTFDHEKVVITHCCESSCRLVGLAKLDGATYRNPLRVGRGVCLRSLVLVCHDTCPTCGVQEDGPGRLLEAWSISWELHVLLL